MKTLKQVMGDLGGYQPKPEGEQNFVKKHVVDKKEDMNGNGDDVFKAAKVKVADRPGERHGYTDKDDDKVNEAVEPKEAEWVSILKKYKVIGNTQGGKKTVAEEVEAEEKALLGEGTEARARFEDYHRDAAEMVKKIGEALKAHKGSVSKEGTHWGHVGDVKHFHRQLQDLHDQLTQQGEYQKAINSPMREEVELEEKTLTPDELKKREEIAQAIERKNPGMEMGKKMAIATAQAKKVAEEVEELDEKFERNDKLTIDGKPHLYVSKGENRGEHRVLETDSNYKWTGKPVKAVHKDKIQKVTEEVELEEDFSKMTTPSLKKWINTRERNAMGGNLSKERSKQYDQAQAELKKRKMSEEVVVEAADAKEGKKAAKGKAVMPATGVYDSIPLGISVKEQVEEETDISMLEMFASLDDEEQKLFVEMLESDGDLLGEIAKEAK